MKKIPTVFCRDQHNRRYVTPLINDECRWVLVGEGRATRKYDGTCVLIRRDGLGVNAWFRREVKPGKPRPMGFREVEYDAVTGKTVGWEPAIQSGFFTVLAEALGEEPWTIEPGTYELCGPKINGNPEGFDRHMLIPHGDYPVPLAHPLSYESLRELMSDPSKGAFGEGIVWHHPDGRMAKLKRRDFPPASDERAAGAQRRLALTDDDLAVLERIRQWGNEAPDEIFSRPVTDDEGIALQTFLDYLLHGGP